MTRIRTAEEIRCWMARKLTQQMNVKPEHLDLDEPLDEQGIDSMQFAILTGELEEWLGCRFTDNPLFHHPSINAVSDFLAQQLQAGKTTIGPVSPVSRPDEA